MLLKLFDIVLFFLHVPLPKGTDMFSLLVTFLYCSTYLCFIHMFLDMFSFFVFV